jgi:hypothetical protein
VLDVAAGTPVSFRMRPPLLLRGHSSDGVRDVEENGLFLGKFPWSTYSSRNCRSAQVIGACFTPTEFRKR